MSEHLQSHEEDAKEQCSNHYQASEHIMTFYLFIYLPDMLQDFVSNGVLACFFLL